MIFRFFTVVVVVVISFKKFPFLYLSYACNCNDRVFLLLLDRINVHFTLHLLSIIFCAFILLTLWSFSFFSCFRSWEFFVVAFKITYHRVFSYLAQGISGWYVFKMSFCAEKKNKASDTDGYDAWNWYLMNIIDY